MRLMTIGVALWSGLVPLTVLAGQTPRQMIEEAVIDYAQAMDAPERAVRLERFRRAQRLFGQVIEDYGIESADLLVNLGNAALQSEQLGSAVLAYRRALEIAPGHTQARQNLDHARRSLPDWVPRPDDDTLWDTFFSWHRTLSRGGQTILTSLCFAATALLLTVAIGWRRTWARTLAVLLGSVWVGLVVLLMWPAVYDGTANDAVITVPEAVVRAADSDGASARLAEPLPAGTEVTVVDRRDPWVRIRLADGRGGYLRASNLTAVRTR